MKRYTIPITLLFMLLFSTACRTDYDIAEVAPSVHLDEEHHTADEHAECEDHEESDSEHAVDEHVEESHAGHNHAVGSRNHGTQWFFNQPWAAPFIWGKLFRDAAIFLVLAAAVFIISGRKRKK